MRKALPPPELTDEDRLRQLVKLAIETAPVIRDVLSGRTGRVPPGVVRRLKSQLRLQERILALGLHTLSNLPDDPTEKSESIACSLRSCSQLAMLD